MTLDASKLPKMGKKFELTARGNYPARVVAIVDLGVQPQKPWKGKEKTPRNEIMLTYELVTEFLKDEDGNDMLDKPRWHSETMGFLPLSAERAKSTQRYEVFDPDHSLYEGKFANILTLPCTITIVHNKALNGNTYANVGAVAPPMKGYEIPPLINEPYIFDRNAPDMDVWERLPEWLQKKIKGSLDFHSTALAKELGEEKEEVPNEKTSSTEENPY